MYKRVYIAAVSSAKKTMKQTPLYRSSCNKLYKLYSLKYYFGHFLNESWNFKGAVHSAGTQAFDAAY